MTDTWVTADMFMEAYASKRRKFQPNYYPAKISADWAGGAKSIQSQKLDLNDYLEWFFMNFFPAHPRMATSPTVIQRFIDAGKINPKKRFICLGFLSEAYMLEGCMNMGYDIESVLLDPGFAFSPLFIAHCFYSMGKGDLIPDDIKEKAKVVYLSDPEYKRIFGPGLEGIVS